MKNDQLVNELDDQLIDEETITSVIHQTLGELSRSESVTNPWLLNLTVVQNPMQKVENLNSVGQYDATWAVRNVFEECLTEMELRNVDDARLLRLRFFEGHTVAGLALKIDRSESNVFYRQRKAIQQLTDCLMAREYKARQEQLQQEQQINKRYEEETISSQRLLLPSITYGSLFGLAEKEETMRNIAVSSEQPWIINVVGMGGVGKTTLAHSLALWAADHEAFEHIIWITAKSDEFNPWSGQCQPYLDLAHSESSVIHSIPHAYAASNVPMQEKDGHQILTSLDTLLDRIASQLGMTELPSDPMQTYAKQEALRSFLDKHPALIVIDNLETLADTMNVIEDCRLLARPSKIVLTSRYSIHSDDIFHMRMDELTEEDSIALLYEEVRGRGHGRITERDVECLKDIYQIIGGNPLALKLVAGQMAILPLHTILTQIRAVDNSSQAERELYSYLYRHTWQLLSPKARHILLALSVLPAEGATLNDLVTVASIELQQLCSALLELVDYSLVNVGGWSDKIYTIYRLTHTFLVNQVLNRESHNDLFCHEERLLLGETHNQQSKRLGKLAIAYLSQYNESPNNNEIYRYYLWRAIEVNHYHDNKEIVVECALMGHEYMMRRGPWQYWGHLLTFAIEAAEQLQDVEARAKLHLYMGQLCRKQNLWEKGKTHLAEANELFVALEDPIWPARIQCLICDHYRDQSKFTKAESYARRALSAQESNGDLTGLAVTCSTLGSLAWERYNIDEGIEWCHRALAIPALKDNPTILALTHSRLGLLYGDRSDLVIGERSDLVTADYHYRLGQAIAEEIQDDGTLTLILTNRAMLLRCQGKFYQSLGMLDESKKIAERCGSVLGGAMVVFNIGMNYLELEEFNLAQEQFNECNRIMGQFGQNYWLAISFWGLAKAQRHLGEYRQSADSLASAADFFSQIDNKALLHSIVKREEGELALCLSDLEKAKECFDLAYRRAIEVKEYKTEFIAAIGLAQIALLRDNQPEANHWLEISYAISKRKLSAGWSALIDKMQGDVALSKQKVKDATRFYQKALSYVSKEPNDMSTILKKNLYTKLDTLTQDTTEPTSNSSRCYQFQKHY